MLIPVYNEEAILEEKLKQLADYLDVFNPDYEVIVCSNGSNDRTDEVGESLGMPKVRFAAIPDRGVGRAFKKMVQEAGSEKIISMDVDLSSDLEFIPECVRMLDEYDVVVGSKRKGEQERQWHRTFISGVFIWMVKVLLGLTYGDYSIGTKGWRRSSIIGYVDGIDHGSSYVVELIYYVERSGGKVIEVPVYCSDTRGSRFNLVHEVFYRLKNLLSFWLRPKTV